MATAVPVILLDTASTLSFTPGEGTPSSTSVAIYDENGTLAESPATTVSGSTISCTVAAGTVDEVGSTYRARWTYTAGGTVYKRDQRFVVRASIAGARLTTSRFVSDYYPLLADRYPRGVSSWQTLIDSAWVEMGFDLSARSIDVNRIIDYAPLERAHAALAAWKIASNYSFGNDVSSVMQAWADSRRADYQTYLTAALANLAWYDGDDDLLPNAGETNVNLSRLRFSR